MSNDCIFIIDTFSLMFQVFHAIPPMTGTQGQPTNAVFGFTRDILSILDRKPTHLMCAFDSPGDGERHQIYEQYKANRGEMPDDLRPQIPLLKELLAGFRIPAIEHAAWEADDVIATIARQAVDAGMEVVIVSSDKDIRQLLGPRIRLFNCRKNEFLDEDGLMKDWGVRPDQVIDYQSLVGDSVDNVPGVPKIGPKTAKTLIEKFGTLDEILANAANAPGKMVQKNLAEFADQARMSRELVRLRTDLPLDFNLDDALISEPDHAALFELFTRLGFRRYSSQVKEQAAAAGISLVTGGSETIHAPKAAAPPAEISFAATNAALQLALEELANHSTVFLDAVVDGTMLRDKRLRTIGLSDGKGHYWYSPLTDGSAGEIPECLALWFRQFAGEIVVADAKPFVHALLNAKIALNARIFDTSVTDYLLDAGARSHDLHEVADRHAAGNSLAAGVSKSSKPRQKTMFDEEEPPAVGSPDPSEQVLLRLQTLEAVTGSIKPALTDASLMDLYDRLERPLISVLAELEHQGIRVDVGELKQQSDKAGARIEMLTAQIYQTAGCEFNIDSPKQLGEVLFTKLKLPILKKTKTGASTDQEVLEQLALVHPLPAMIIERRQLTKLKGTYLDTLPALVHPFSGRVHATFHQTVASTGRLSSSDPNLQNIPIRTDEGRQIRRAFRAGSAGWELVCADYSQIELRVLAHFSRDEALMDAFRRGIDIHAAVAADVFQVPVTEVNSDQRRVAKAVNFGVIYGQSPFGLATALNIDRSEAAHFIDSYFQRYAGVARFCEQVLEETVRTGFARTILNRRRAISGIRSTTGIQRNMPERTAINTVIQGSAADLIKKAMIEVSQQLKASGLSAELLLQIHDELVFEVNGDHRAQLIELIVPGMQNAMQLDVPLVVDVSFGPNWLDQQDVELN